MARQRFIWPDIWKDPVFGRLTADEQVFFIGCFSIADDEGRLNADPAYLRGELFTYKDLTLKRVQQIRDAVIEKCLHIHLYRANGNDYIALLKWGEYQKPKYPKPSKLPAPFLEDSPKPSGSLPENGSLGRVGLDRVRVGLGGDDDPPAADDPEDPPGQELVVVEGGEPRTLAASVSAQTLLGEFIDGARGVGIEPPDRFKSHLARELKRLLEEGQSAEAVRAGMARMVERRVMQPSLLPNFVMEAQLPSRPVSGQAQRYGRGVSTETILDMAARAAAEEREAS